MDKQKINICSYCQKQCRNSTALKRHERTHINHKPKKCLQCPEMLFDSKNEYIIHINEIHQGTVLDYYICSTCGKQFKTRSELTNHNNSKCGTIKLYKCEVCNQKLMNPGSLYNHMLKHNSEPNFMCKFCGKLFLTTGQLKVHERSHTQEKVFICNICGKGFCHRQSLITHSTLHTGIKPYSCENCGHSFSCIGNLLKHRKAHADCGLIPLTTHRVLNPATKQKVKINTPANLKLKRIEKQIALKRLTLVQNMETSENASDIMVEENENKVTPEQQFSDIVKSMDNYCQDGKSSTDNILYDSEYFNGFVSSKPETKVRNINTLKDDVNNSTTIASKCNDAYNPKLTADIDESQIKTGKGISSNHTKIYCKPTWLLQNETVQKESHINADESRKHQNDSSIDILSCHDCDKLFSNSDSLQSHTITFHKTASKKTYTYVCERCGKQFRQKSTLLRHSDNNCSDGPLIECKVCGKKLSSVHSRKAHMRIHDAEKKLFCKFCKKRFRWAGQLKIHERSHTGEKPFSCLYCPKAFAYRESLITHSSLHTGIKPHLCEACGSRFSCIGNLIKHRTSYAKTCGVWYSKNK